MAKKMLFGFAFFFANIVFMLQILGAGEAFLADRFVYIAYFGLFFMIAQLYVYLIENQIYKKNFIHIAYSIFLVFLGLKSFQQIKTWQNSNTLWTNVIYHFPNEDYLAYNNRGNYFLQQKQTSKKIWVVFSTSISGWCAKCSEITLVVDVDVYIDVDVDVNALH